MVFKMASRKIEQNAFDVAEVSYELKVPKDRVAVIIGKDGETKQKIEAESQVKLSINSEEGDVLIVGKNPLKLFDAKEVVRAIARGFNPDIALLLLKGDFALEIINLKDIVKNKNHLQRLKGRIIGTEGKTRRIIEELTMCSLSIYGKTVSIIGRAEYSGIAKQAIDMIIEGSPHASVYTFLEKKRKQMGRIGSAELEVEDSINDKFSKFK